MVEFSSGLKGMALNLDPCTAFERAGDMTGHSVFSMTVWMRVASIAVWSSSVCPRALTSGPVDILPEIHGAVDGGDRQCGRRRFRRRPRDR